MDNKHQITEVLKEIVGDVYQARRIQVKCAALHGMGAFGTGKIVTTEREIEEDKYFEYCSMQ